MKLIDADELMRKLQHDCEQRKDPNFWFIFGFISRYITEAPDLGAKINKHPMGE